MQRDFRRVFSAPVILIAVPDSAIDATANGWPRSAANTCVARRCFTPAERSVPTPLADLQILAPQLVRCIHCRLSAVLAFQLSKGRIFAIEGDPRAVRVASQALPARSAGRRSIECRCKPLYHAAAALAAGQVLALVEAALQLFISIGMKRREALKALLP